MGRPSVALVLGAGGLVGAAYHAGALAALEAATGWDPRAADLVVGTSAGALVAASLRGEVAAGAHLARAEAGSAWPGRPAGSPPVVRPAAARLPRPASPWLALTGVRPGRLRPGLALAGALPVGTLPTDAVADQVRDLVPGRWPDRPTWVCAVDLARGARAVFGRDDLAVPDLGAAVAASIAVPGLFVPVVVGGRRYVDGGAWSPTNADLVAGLGFDLVVVVSPMSSVPGALRLGPGRLRPRPAPPARYLHSRGLAGEVAAVRARGSAALVVQPTAECQEAMGDDALDEGRAGEVAAQARRSVGRLLARPDLAERAALLAAAGRAPTPRAHPPP